MNPTTVEIIATTLFALAVIHTFVANRFQMIAHRFPQGSIGENLFHMLGEVEVVFGLWAAILLIFISIFESAHESISYAESLNFTEPMFVFAVMTIAATRPIIDSARSAILLPSKVLPIHKEISTYFACMTLGPLLGSLITEPAAMTVTALILRDRYFNGAVTNRFRYLTLGVLFVNVSIGGVLTTFAAPPVLMVAGTWKWTNSFMMETFGWKATIAVFINALLATLILRKELMKIKSSERTKSGSVPHWLRAIHFVALATVVMTAHHPVIFVGLFLFFIGAATITREHQSPLLLKQSLLVGFFLGGLVVLGGLQRWWLEPLLGGMSPGVMFFGATGLTAVTDNAALTFLGSLIPGISDELKYSLVAGAVAGGGLTVIANAPNPAGFAILQKSFGEDGISPMKLLLAAAIPTAVAMSLFWIFWI